MVDGIRERPPHTLYEPPLTSVVASHSKLLSISEMVARFPARGTWLIVLCVSACGGEPRPSADEPVSITVDATRPQGPLQRIWPFFGYDELNYTTTAEGAELLATLVDSNTAQVQVRSHFLFNNGDGTPDLKWGSTNVYEEDDAGTPRYDWSLTDQILDTVTGAGALPFVELGFMPEALSSRPSPYRNTSLTQLNGGCFYPPKDYGKWAKLVSTWAGHVDARYVGVAANWRWELWNEPDSAYWHGTFEEYAKLYDFTEAALHEALPEARLGGPAVVRADGEFFRQFLQHCVTGTNSVTGAVGTRLDHVTFHAKGGVAVVDGDVQLHLGNQLRLHRTGFATVASFPELVRTPIYITEADPDGCAACPASLIAGAEYRLSPAYGAYEVAMMKRTLELQDDVGVELAGILTWAFTFPNTPYFAGYRALSTNGIDLPVLGAFKLLGKLEGDRLPLESSGAQSLEEILASSVRKSADVDGLSAISGSTIRVLVWNYHDTLVAAPSAPVRLRVQLPPALGGKVLISHLRVDAEHGNAHARWRALGMPAAPSEAELAELRLAMAPAKLLDEALTDVEADGSVQVSFELPRFGVSLVSIEPGD
ncbi:MAG: xynB 2 [Polyangiaceae bacterium]|nr:xynB 2 [Polyangiaceae bacterium]